MPRSGVIHIGLPKTATTSFQNAVFNNRERLLSDHRMFYPSIEANHTNALCAMFLDDPRKHITVRNMGINTIEEAEKLRQRYREKIERDIESADWDTLVFSAEGLSNLPVSSLSELKVWASKYAREWKVLFWSRHPVGYTTSVMQQMLKGGEHLDKMLEHLPLPRFEGKANNAFRAFGREAVSLTAFEDARKEPGGVVAAFCRRIGLEEPAVAEIASSAMVENESLSLLAVRVLDNLNRQRPLFVNGKRNPLRAQGELEFIQRIRGPKFDLPAEVKQRIRVETRSDVKWLNDTFKTNHYLDVFHDEVDAVPEPSESFPDDLVDSLALLISDLINARRSPT